MQIKRFEARDMAEALKMIKREFGPQAVILSARDITKGKGVLGYLRSPGVEVTAATDTHNGTGKPKTEKFPARKWTLRKDPPAGAGPKIQLGAGPSQPSNFGQRGQVKRPMTTAKERSHFRRNDNLICFLNLYEELLNQGVEEAIASGLIESLRERAASEKVLGDREVKSHLKEALKEMGVPDRADRVRQGKPRVVALVGAAGVGKTTTLAKIAVTEAFQKGKEIALIALNDHRIGATAQIEAYGNVLRVPVVAVSNRNQLKEILKRFRDKDLILIDTPGISPNDIYGINELKMLLEFLDPLEIHLLAAAGTREKDFESIFNKFGMLPIGCLLFTKIDETVEYGSMLNAVVRTRLPVSYFTNGQEVPENIEEGSIERLIEMLCTGGKRRVQGCRESSAENPRDGGRYREKGLQAETYVANRSSDLFHHPSCKWVERIDKRNMVVFKTRAEALANHFRPCRACQPVRAEEDDEPSSAGAANEEMREMVVY
jgi:flagellar biosynthesis protein FlhF